MKNKLFFFIVLISIISLIGLVSAVDIRVTDNNTGGFKLPDVKTILLIAGGILVLWLIYKDSKKRKFPTS